MEGKSIRTITSKTDATIHESISEEVKKFFQSVRIATIIWNL